MRRSVWAVSSATVIAFGVTWFRFPDPNERLMVLTMIVGGAYQSVSDFRTRHVPRVVTYAMGSVAILGLFLADRMWSLVPIAAVAVGVVFLLLHQWREKSLGFGDVLLAPVLALFVGWFDVFGVPLWLLGASLGAALTAIFCRQRHVAFAPWLVASAVVTILYVGSPTYSG